MPATIRGNKPGITGFFISALSGLRLQRRTTHALSGQLTGNELILKVLAYDNAVAGATLWLTKRLQKIN